MSAVDEFEAVWTERGQLLQRACVDLGKASSRVGDLDAQLHDLNPEFGGGGPEPGGDFGEAADDTEHVAKFDPVRAEDRDPIGLTLDLAGRLLECVQMCLEIVRHEHTVRGESR